MSSELLTPGGLPPESSGEFDLGTWLGRRQAFSIMAGKASAAEVECIRKIRDQKLYLARTSDWGEFCAQYIGASKSHVNGQIRYLLTYGPQYFELAQITRIPPDAYRAIAGHVTSQGVELDGEVIPLVTENSQRLAAAVSELRTRTGKQVTQSEDVFPDIALRLKRLIEAMGAMPRFQSYDGRSWELVQLLEHLRKVAKERGVPIDL